MSKYLCVLQELEVEVEAPDDLSAQEVAFAKTVRDLKPADFWVVRERPGERDGPV